MARRLIDISSPLKAGIKSDPPHALPKIDYVDHHQTAPAMAEYMGVRVDQLPGGEYAAIERCAISTHNGTHLDAPYHYFSTMNHALKPGGEPSWRIDEVPLENFYTSAICLDLSHVPLKHAITVPEMAAALEVSGQEIRPRDTVLLYMATNDRLLGKPGYLHDFPGLALESVHWLADRGILMFGVEAISPAPEGEPNYLAHMACAERGITHMECLANLDQLVGRGRFRFIGFPLKIRGGTASPIRAVAVFD